MKKITYILLMVFLVVPCLDLQSRVPPHACLAEDMTLPECEDYCRENYKKDPSSCSKLSSIFESYYSMYDSYSDPDKVLFYRELSLKGFAHKCMKKKTSSKKDYYPEYFLCTSALANYNDLLSKKVTLENPLIKKTQESYLKTCFNPILFKYPEEREDVCGQTYKNLSKSFDLRTIFFKQKHRIYCINALVSLW